MTTFHLFPKFVSKKTVLLCLSTLTIATPVILPIGILGTARPVEAQGMLMARGGVGKAARVLPKIADLLIEAFGFGSRVLDRLPASKPRHTFTQRQLRLIESVRYQESVFYRTYGYSIPLSAQNLNVVMARSGAYSSEAEFVATVMHYFGSR